MARNRQRSKQRQAERRDARVAAREAIEEDVGAPPQNVGRSDTVTDHSPPAPIVDGRLEGDELEDDGTGIDSEEFAVAEAEAEALSDTQARGPRGQRGDASAVGQPIKGDTALSRIFGFLSACWAELQRVQWPDRRQLTQLTGIVLFFVILAGAYLGALDAVFSKLIQAIL